MLLIAFDVIVIFLSSVALRWSLVYSRQPIQVSFHGLISFKIFFKKLNFKKISLYFNLFLVKGNVSVVYI